VKKNMAKRRKSKTTTKKRRTKKRKNIRRAAVKRKISKKKKKTTKKRIYRFARLRGGANTAPRAVSRRKAKKKSAVGRFDIENSSF
jgi:hypothetical protein